VSCPSRARGFRQVRRSIGSSANVRGGMNASGVRRRSFFSSNWPKDGVHSNEHRACEDRLNGAVLFSRCIFNSKQRFSACPSRFRSVFKSTTAVWTAASRVCSVLALNGDFPAMLRPRELMQTRKSQRFVG
jgi:hypothetical protein